MTELKRLREMAYDVLCGADFEEITAGMDDEEKRDFKLFFSGYYEGYDRGYTNCEVGYMSHQARVGLAEREEALREKYAKYTGYEKGRQDAEANIWPAQYTKCGIIKPEE